MGGKAWQPFLPWGIKELNTTTSASKMGDTKACFAKEVQKSSNKYKRKHIKYTETQSHAVMRRAIAKN